jgi:hypothetical protein
MMRHLPSRKSKPEGGDSHGEEGSQGREEEGGKEEVAIPIRRFDEGGPRPLFLFVIRDS